METTTGIGPATPDDLQTNDIKVLDFSYKKRQQSVKRVNATNSEAELATEAIETHLLGTKPEAAATEATKATTNLLPAHTDKNQHAKLTYTPCYSPSWTYNDGLPHISTSWQPPIIQSSSSQQNHKFSSSSTTHDRRVSAESMDSAYSTVSASHARGHSATAYSSRSRRASSYSIRHEDIKESP